MLAILDIAVAKGHDALQFTCSLSKSLELTAIYTLFYFSLLGVNYHATGYFPYPFMRGFTVAKWVAFFFTQCSIVGVFCVLNWGVSLLPAF
eukprot:UN3156